MIIDFYYTTGDSGLQNVCENEKYKVNYGYLSQYFNFGGSDSRMSQVVPLCGCMHLKRNTEIQLDSSLKTRRVV